MRITQVIAVSLDTCKLEGGVEFRVHFYPSDFYTQLQLGYVVNYNAIVMWC